MDIAKKSPLASKPKIGGKPASKKSVQEQKTVDSTPSDGVTLSNGQPKDKSLIRKFAEGTGGVVNAALSLPRAVLPAAVLGGLEGIDRLDPETDKLTDEQIGKYYAYAGAAQSVAIAGAMGIVAGPAAAAAMVASELPREAVGLVPFIKGGGAAQVGAELSKAVEKVIEPGDSKLEAAKKGSWAALKAAVAECAKVRYQEGKGMVSGIADGSGPVWNSIFSSDGKEGEKSEGITFGKVWNGARKALDAPAHFIQGSFQGFDPSTEWDKGDFIQTRAAALTLIGLTAGMFVGAPIAATAVGAGIALGNRFFDNDEKLESTINEIGESAKGLQTNQPSFDNDIAQKNHNGFEAGMIGLAKAFS